MRKLILGLAAFAMSVGMAVAAQAQVKIAVSIPAADHGWTGGVVYHAERIAKALREAHKDVDIIVKTSPDGASQANAVEDLVTQGINALVILPHNPDELAASIKAVHDKGIFVTIVDRALSDQSFQDLYVGGDNPQYGIAAAEYFKKKFPNGGKIVVMRGIATAIDNIRIEAFNNQIARVIHRACGMTNLRHLFLKMRAQSLKQI